MSRAAMQQALAYIEEVDYGPYDKWPVIIALKQALAEPDSDYERGFVDGMNLQTKGSVDKAVNRMAEPEQAPVAWRVQRSDGQYELYFLKAAAERAAECYIKRPPVEPLYTAPTPRKPLTVFEIDAIAEHLDKTTIGWATHEFAAAIEKAHGIGEQHE